MFTPPDGPVLTASSARELDDSYFQSRPFGYFSSRIDSLVKATQSTVTGDNQGLGADVLAALGETSLGGLLDFDQSDRTLQVATDAFALRHHAAESVVRLYHGLTVGTATQGSVPCVWAAIAEGPTRTVDLVSTAQEHLLSPQGHEGFWKIVFPEALVAEVPAEEQSLADQALNVVGDWLVHAMNLLVRSDINVNAAHNKVKHGLAVRARGDLRLTFSTQAPDLDGNVALSGLSGEKAADIFDGITLDYLARPPKVGDRKQGLEVSSLRLDPATLLAETWLMIIAHSAIFHVAASKHFASREVSFQAFPRLPLGPTPAHLLGEAVVGMRFPVTTPPDGGPLDRKTGVAFRTSFVPLNVNVARKFSGKLVDG